MNPLADLDFSGKTILVVGGSSGIGNGIARGFLSHGAHVHVWGTRAGADYSAEDGSDLRDLVYTQVDVTDAAAVDAQATAFASLDVLVLSQGIVQYGRQEFTPAGWQAVMAVNIDSVMRCAMAFYPALKTASGKVIIVSSVAAFTATRGNPAYSASKAGAAGLTKSLGEAWIGDGIHVNGIAPGLVPTKITAVTTNHPGRRDAALAAIPARRFGTPADMAGPALFLASPLADYMVGQTLVVDGGMTLS